MTWLCRNHYGLSISTGIPSKTSFLHTSFVLFPLFFIRLTVIHSSKICSMSNLCKQSLIPIHPSDRGSHLCTSSALRTHTTALSQFLIDSIQNYLLITWYVPHTDYTDTIPPLTRLTKSGDLFYLPYINHFNLYFQHITKQSNKCLINERNKKILYS